MHENALSKKQFICLFNSKMPCIASVVLQKTSRCVSMEFQFLPRDWRCWGCPNYPGVKWLWKVALELPKYFPSSSPKSLGWRSNKERLSVPTATFWFPPIIRPVLVSWHLPSICYSCSKIGLSEMSGGSKKQLQSGESIAFILIQWAVKTKTMEIILILIGPEWNNVIPNTNGSFSKRVSNNLKRLTFR